jgi:hypothetical protein
VAGPADPAAALHSYRFRAAPQQDQQRFARYFRIMSKVNNLYMNILHGF